MDAHSYWYFEPYQENVDEALRQLRQRKFSAGRYNPVIAFPEFPLGPDSPSPGAQHSSIDEAREDAAEDGTRSILDLHYISDYPEFFAVTRLDDEALFDLYETAEPTRIMVENNMAFLEDVDRGQGVYFVLYKEGEPDEIFFGGYSFD